MKGCKRRDCDRKHRARGYCITHYNQWNKVQRDKRRRQEERRQRQLAPYICHHIDCGDRADYWITLPHPIARTESACHYHAQTLLGSRIPGITVETPIGEPE